MKTTALAAFLIAALALTGCSRNNDQTETNACRIQLRRVMNYFGAGEPEPLVVQVSEGSKAYIWQFSDKLAVTESVVPDVPPFFGKSVPASTLADVQPQATFYKQAQTQRNKPARMVLASDDDAKCGAVFEVIADARRAGITEFYFETFCRPAGKTGELRLCK